MKRCTKYDLNQEFSIFEIRDINSNIKNDNVDKLSEMYNFHGHNPDEKLIETKLNGLEEYYLSRIENFDRPKIYKFNFGTNRNNFANEILNNCCGSLEGQVSFSYSKTISKVNTNTNEEGSEYNTDDHLNNIAIISNMKVIS